jgi:hypothetical protein
MERHGSKDTLKEVTDSSEDGNLLSRSNQPRKLPSTRRSLHGDGELDGSEECGPQDGSNQREEESPESSLEELSREVSEDLL